MTLALDFGSASVKAILVGGSHREKDFFSFNLGFRSPILNRSSLLSAIRIVEALSGEVLLEGERILPNLYVCVGLPVYDVSEISSQPVILTGQALSSLDLPILDVGAQMVRFRERVSIAPVMAEDVVKWLPFKLDLGEVANYIENKKVYSSILPVTPRDLYIEQALARARLIDLFRSQKIEVDFPEVYLSGAVFSRVPYLEQAVLMTLDALQPRTPFKIWLDRNQILPVSGLIKYHSTQEFSQLGDELTPLFLATTLSLVESATVSIDLGFGEPQEIDLKKGDLYVFPLNLGEQALVKVTVSSAKKRGEVYEVTGGAVGIVFDLRGRPLDLPESSRSRCDLLKLWDGQIGASGRLKRI